MKRPARGFRFDLEALCRMRTCELDALRLELARAEREVKRGRDHLDALEVRFAASRHEWSRRTSESRALDLQWQRVAASYLADLTRRIAAAAADVRALEAACEEVLARVTAAHRDLEALERHRERSIEAFNLDAGRRELARADESWLHLIPEEDPA